VTVKAQLFSSVGDISTFGVILTAADTGKQNSRISSATPQKENGINFLEQRQGSFSYESHIMNF